MVLVPWASNSTGIGQCAFVERILPIQPIPVTPQRLHQFAALELPAHLLPLPQPHADPQTKAQRQPHGGHVAHDYGSRLDARPQREIKLKQEGVT